jgi:hypothetical protein
MIIKVRICPIHNIMYVQVQSTSKYASLPLLARFSQFNLVTFILYLEILPTLKLRFNLGKQCVDGVDWMSISAHSERLVLKEYKIL